jgi:hypothetical protein
MTPEAKRIKEILERAEVVVDRKELDKIIKDRLDFGFDSIYFRYAEVCDELAAYQSVVDHVPAHEARKRMNGRKMHFYQALEQLVQAHPGREEDPF